MKSDDFSFLDKSIDRIAGHLERAQIADYVQLLNSPRRLFFLNLWGGIARGVGIVIGFTIVGAILLMLLQELALLNLPIVGQFIADIVKIVKAQMDTPTLH